MASSLVALFRQLGSVQQEKLAALDALISGHKSSVRELIIAFKSSSEAAPNADADKGAMVDEVETEEDCQQGQPKRQCTEGIPVELIAEKKPSTRRGATTAAAAAAAKPPPARKAPIRGGRGGAKKLADVSEAAEEEAAQLACNPQTVPVPSPAAKEAATAPPAAAAPQPQPSPPVKAATAASVAQLQRPCNDVAEQQQEQEEGPTLDSPPKAKRQTRRGQQTQPLKTVVVQVLAPRAPRPTRGTARPTATTATVIVTPARPQTRKRGVPSATTNDPQPASVAKAAESAGVADIQAVSCTPASPPPPAGQEASADGVAVAATAGASAQNPVSHRKAVASSAATAAVGAEGGRAPLPVDHVPASASKLASIAAAVRKLSVAASKRVSTADLAAHTPAAASSGVVRKQTEDAVTAVLMASIIAPGGDGSLYATPSDSPSATPVPQDNQQQRSGDLAAAPSASPQLLPAPGGITAPAAAAAAAAAAAGDACQPGSVVDLTSPGPSTFCSPIEATPTDPVADLLPSAILPVCQLHAALMPGAATATTPTPLELQTVANEHAATSAFGSPVGQDDLLASPAPSASISIQSSIPASLHKISPSPLSRASNSLSSTSPAPAAAGDAMVGSTGHVHGPVDGAEDAGGDDDGSGGAAVADASMEDVDAEGDLGQADLHITHAHAAAEDRGKGEGMNPMGTHAAAGIPTTAAGLGVAASSSEVGVDGAATLLPSPPEGTMQHTPILTPASASVAASSLATSSPLPAAPSSEEGADGAAIGKGDHQGKGVAPNGGSARGGESVDVQAPAGKASKVVTCVRSFIAPVTMPEVTIAAGKKPVKVKALEQAKAARAAEEAKVAEKAEKAVAKVAEVAKVAKAAKAAEEAKVAEAATTAATATESSSSVRQKAAAFQQMIQGEQEAKRRDEMKKATTVAAARQGAVSKATDVNEKLKRAELRRREEEERKKAEIELKAKQKEERLKAARQLNHAAAAAPTTAAGGRDGGAAAAAAAPKSAAESAPSSSAPSAAAPAAKAASGEANKSAHVLLASQSNAASTAPAAGGAPAESKGVTGVTGGATALAQQILAAKKLQVALANNNGSGSSGAMPRTPAEAAKEARNIAAISSSPYVNSVKRTPAGGGQTPGRIPKVINFNYEISPYRSDSEEEADLSPDPSAQKKPVPEWALQANLLPALEKQTKTDPDKLFDNKVKTCTLEDIFSGMPPAPPAGAANGKTHVKRDWRKRGSSGNWIADRITWQEEIAYKRGMGFL